MSEEQYIIRPFKLEDKNSVVELWKICRLTRPWNNPEKDIERKLNVQSEMFLVLEIHFGKHHNSMFRCRGASRTQQFP